LCLNLIDDNTNNRSCYVMCMRRESLCVEVVLLRNGTRLPLLTFRFQFPVSCVVNADLTLFLLFLFIIVTAVFVFILCSFFPHFFSIAFVVLCFSPFSCPCGGTVGSTHRVDYFWSPVLGTDWPVFFQPL